MRAHVGRLSVPRNTSLNCTMPELVNSSVGSFAGTRLDERTTEWPFDSKYCRNLLRMSETFMLYRAHPHRGRAQSVRLDLQTVD